MSVRRGRTSRSISAVVTTPALTRRSTSEVGRGVLHGAGGGITESDVILAKATGARIVSKIEDLTAKDVGFAGEVEALRIGGEDMTAIRNCQNPKVVTLLVRAGTVHVADEIKRAIEDAVGDIACVMRTGRVVGGAGAVEIELARQLESFANSLSGREQLAPAGRKNPSYEYTQRHPDDKEAVEGQGPIALHGLEHLVTSDKGVLMFRGILKKAIQATQQGNDPKGILRDPAKAAFIPTSAGSIVRD